MNETMLSMSMDCVLALQVHRYIKCISMCNGIFIKFRSTYSLTCRLVVIVDCCTSSCHPTCLILVCHLSYSVCPDQGSLLALPPGSPTLPVFSISWCTIYQYMIMQTQSHCETFCQVASGKLRPNWSPHMPILPSYVSAPV